MSNESLPEQTEVHEHAEALDLGLVAAFRPGVDFPVGNSVLDALGASASRVHLREVQADEVMQSSPPRAALLPGRHEPGSRLQLHGEIARGGMGCVLKGRDVDLGRDIAVKVLLETHAGRTELIQRFIEEAQIAGQLQHPGVVPVYELGQFANQRLYFTMKLVKGKTLGKLLVDRVEPAQERSRFLGIFLQVCQAVAYAHSKGVIHRDLKPSNIMVGAFGEVQVMDWGLAKVLQEGGIAHETTSQLDTEEQTAIRTRRRTDSEMPDRMSSGTQAGSVLGTPAYMAPEQARGEVERLDERADVFGLGAILCEILTGKPPYLGRDSVEVHRKATRAELDDALSRLGACGADGELVDLARRCLCEEPTDRPRDAGVLAAELTTYREAVEQRLRQAELASAEARARAVEERKRQRLTVGLAVAVVLLAGGSGWFAWQRADAHRQVELALVDAEEQVRAGQLAEARLLADRAEARLTVAASAGQRHRLAQIRADLALADRIEEVRLQAADHYSDTTRVDLLFGALFRDCGIKLQILSDAEVAEQISASALRERLAAALDHWAWFIALVDPSRRDQLLAIARQADPNPWRDQLRNPGVRNDNGALQKLAGDATLLDQPPGTILLLSSVFMERQDWISAEKVLRGAQRRYPDDCFINNELSLVLEERVDRRGELSAETAGEVLACRRAVVARHPTSLSAQRALALSLANHGKATEAEGLVRECLPRARDMAERLSLLECLGPALLKQKKLTEAVAVFQEILTLRPTAREEALCQINLGLCHAQMGRNAEVIRALHQSLAIQAKNIDGSFQHHPLGVNIQLVVGELLLLVDDLPGATALARKVIASHPNVVRGHVLLGKVLGKQRQWGEAEKAYRQAVALKPGESELHSLLGQMLSEQGKTIEAATCYQTAIALRPDRVETVVNLAALFVQLGKPREAEMASRHAILLDPRNGAAHSNLGTALSDQGQHAEAEQALRRSIELEENNPVNHYNLANSLLKQGKYLAAIPFYRRAITLDDRQHSAYTNLGLALLNTGQPAQAETMLRKALAVKPDHLNALFHLGNALTRQEKFAAALQVHRRGYDQARRQPGAEAARFEAALKRSERLVERESKLRDILEGKKQPADAIESAEIAEFLLEWKKRPVEALRFYRAAFAADRGLLEDANHSHAYNAACAALRVAQTARDDAPRWREQALVWLRIDLLLRRKQLEVEPRLWQRDVRHLRHTQVDPDLRAVRDPSARARLPVEEQKTWGRYWDEVTTLLKTAGVRP